MAIVAVVVVVVVEEWSLGCTRGGVIVCCSPTCPAGCWLLQVDWEEVRRLESLLNRKPKPGRPSGRTNLRGWEEDEWMKAGFYDAYNETNNDNESS